MKKNTSILIASPIRQKPEILTHFLSSIKRLKIERFEIHVAFIDDNTDPISSKIINSFEYGESYRLWKAHSNDEYITENGVHQWTNPLIWKVAEFKDHLIKYAIEQKFDYIFLVDSDLVLHPEVLNALYNADKPIVSEVFWTSWRHGEIKAPQVWRSGEYSFLEAGFVPPPEVAALESQKFLKKLYKPGVYEVGGLGACTLIKREALLRGLSFRKIDNLSYMGEDRHFCIRARVLDIGLYAETSAPPFHIYREADLECVPDYIEYTDKNYDEPHVTLSMIVRNEEGRFLEKALLHHRKIIDRAVIIDDNCADGTIEIIKNILADKEIFIIKNDESLFDREHLLRKKQWLETIKTHPDWILNLDADEIMEENYFDKLKPILSQTGQRQIGFRLHDMWDIDHYRDDHLWNAHMRVWPFLFRYTPFFNYEWNKMDHHCGRFPTNLGFFETLDSQIRIKHMGWSSEKIRMEKYQRYARLDPNAHYGVKEQYQSILDKSPILKKWN